MYLKTIVTLFQQYWMFIILALVVGLILVVIIGVSKKYAHNAIKHDVIDGVLGNVDEPLGGVAGGDWGDLISAGAQGYRMRNIMGVGPTIFTGWLHVGLFPVSLIPVFGTGFDIATNFVPKTSIMLWLFSKHTQALESQLALEKTMQFASNANIPTHEYQHVVEQSKKHIKKGAPVLAWKVNKAALIRMNRSLERIEVEMRYRIATQINALVKTNEPLTPDQEQTLQNTINEVEALVKQADGLVKNNMTDAITLLYQAEDMLTKSVNDIDNENASRPSMQPVQQTNAFDDIAHDAESYADKQAVAKLADKEPGELYIPSTPGLPVKNGKIMSKFIDRLLK